MDRLPFAKPVRIVAPDLLRSYCRFHAACEVDGCRRKPTSEPHHLVPRSRGRSDLHENLLRLCPSHHRAWHLLGGRAGVWLGRMACRGRLDGDELHASDIAAADRLVAGGAENLMPDGPQAPEPPPGNRERRADANRLARLVLEGELRPELFHTPGADGVPYATIAVDGHLETWRLHSRLFRHFLERRAYQATGRLPKVSTTSPRVR